MTKYIVTEDMLKALLTLGYELGTTELGERDFSPTMFLRLLGPIVNTAQVLAEIEVDAQPYNICLSLDGDGVDVTTDAENHDMAYAVRKQKDFITIKRE